MLTAKEVRTCEFDMHRLFEEGYDTDQVDDILDQCADTIEILYHLLCQSHDRIDALEQEVPVLLRRSTTYIPSTDPEGDVNNG